ncbi:ABC transporter substrate-binding protein [Paraburkholderia sp. RL17-337-BIB-A]|uniref:ABC transporter substrate-binding protein n=1 Tax=Paraburkholderia sp. RL17-337-BIB-A TaxID=3031636 RepID=UPI0038BB2875
MSPTACGRGCRIGMRVGFNKMWRGLAGLAGLFAAALLGANALADSTLKIAAFDGAFVNFPLYVATDLHLFDKHGVRAELVYGLGSQAPTMVMSGATEFGGFAVEHGLLLMGKGQQLKLLVLCQSNPPFDLIVRKDIALPNLRAGFPKSVADLKGLRLGISAPGASADTGLRLLLRQAGLDPERDVKIVSIGDAMTQLTALQNRTVDGTMAFEPIQTQAVLGSHAYQSVINLEKGDAGPEIYREYAFNGLFARKDYIDAHPVQVKAVVAAIVEAEQIINDPARIEDVTRVAAAHMHGIPHDLLKEYVATYRGVFEPVASPLAIANVNRFVMYQNQVSVPIPYESVVDTRYMPRTRPW